MARSFSSHASSDTPTQVSGPMGGWTIILIAPECAAAFTGAFNISCAGLVIANDGYADNSLTIPAGQTLTITDYTELNGQIGYNAILQSDTPESPFYVHYLGTYADCGLWRASFIDIDASGSAQHLVGLNGDDPVRCVNILNRPLLDLLDIDLTWLSPSLFIIYPYFHAAYGVSISSISRSADSASSSRALRSTSLSALCLASRSICLPSLSI